MNEWWNGLQLINQWMYGAAFFFSLIFVWQLIMVFMGMGGHDVDADADMDVGGDVDVDADGDFDIHADGGDFDGHAEFHTGHDEFDVTDAAHSTAAFRLLSFRSILAFFTLFTWTCAMYLDTGVQTSLSLLYGTLWGAVAMVLVAGLLAFMKRMTETGTIDVATCLGTMGTVYYDIPADGQGEVRTTVSGTLTHLKARVAGGDGLRAGTPVRITRILGPGAVEVSIEQSEAPKRNAGAPEGEGQE